jgi:hypothetical protein
MYSEIIQFQINRIGFGPKLQKIWIRRNTAPHALLVVYGTELKIVGV